MGHRTRELRLRITCCRTGVSRAVLTDHGKITGLLEVVQKTPSALLTNPAILTGAAGLMAQLAMQQTMDEITDYLAVIDAKVDAVLRAQTDAVVADMIGVELEPSQPGRAVSPTRHRATGPVLRRPVVPMLAAPVDQVPEGPDATRTVTGQWTPVGRRPYSTTTPGR
ncbi:hypothetical protein ACWD6N_31790 [Micromonospora sp. NPDC005163]